MIHGTFNTALKGGAKVEMLVKVDVKYLIKRGIEHGNAAGEYVDGRTAIQLCENQEEGNGGAVQVFRFPAHYFAQEASFVPRSHPKSEDDGYLLT